MRQIQHVARPVERPYEHSTAQFAAQIGIVPQTARKRYSQTGSYYGIRPLKLPNGKLRWPSKALEILSSHDNAATLRQTSEYLDLPGRPHDTMRELFALGCELEHHLPSLRGRSSSRQLRGTAMLEEVKRHLEVTQEITGLWANLTGQSTAASVVLDLPD